MYDTIIGIINDEFEHQSFDQIKSLFEFINTCKELDFINTDEYADLLCHYTNRLLNIQRRPN